MNIAPELRPLWKRIKGQFRGTPHQRAERFIEYVEGDERAAIQAVEAEADERLAQAVAELRARPVPGNGNGELRAWLDEQDAAQARALRLRKPGKRKPLAAGPKKRKSDANMAKRSSARRSTSLARRPTVVKPVVLKQTKIVHAKRKGGHRRRGGGLGLGGFLNGNRTQMVLAGAAVGFIDKAGWNLPKLPYAGEHGTIAIAAYLLSDGGRNQMADNVCTAALVLSGFEFAKTGSISGGDDFDGGL